MKRNVFLGMLLVSSQMLWAQPANDNCANAITLTVDAACTTGTNVAATTESGETAQGCWGTAISHTVWYKFTTSTAGLYNVSTVGSAGDPDTQIKIISGTCAAQTTVACNEDATGFRAAISANLAAATTYLIQVDFYSTSTGAFCIGVNKINATANDCVFSAIDITSQINGITATNLFDCAAYTYSNATTKPSHQDLSGDASTCDGGVMDKRDVWFKFTVSAATPPTWLSVYQQTGTTPSYHAELYSGTPTGSCGTAAVGGLTFIDCSAGHYTDGSVGFTVPGSNTTLVEPITGAARDKGLCTTPIHPRVDISGLPAGDYYFRVYEGFGGDPTDGVFNLCAERAIGTTGTNDRCSAVPLNTPCQSNNPLDIHVSLPNSGNNGMMGNAAPCNRTDEPQLAAAAAGDLRNGCAGPFTTYIGGLNNVMNNSAIYCIEVAGDVGCTATGDVSFSNVQYGGTNGNTIQIQIISGSCNGGTCVAAVTSNASCFDVRPAGGTWAPGPYWIVVDGQDGQLAQYDLNIDITFSGLSCPTVAPCTSILGALFEDFDLQKLDGNETYVEWKTSNEETTDYYLIQRSADGILFENIEEVDAKKATTNKYHFIDVNNDIRGEYTYYRIAERDINGETLYSETKSVRNNEQVVLLSKYNLLGQEVDLNYKGLCIEHYSNGLIIKRFQF